METWNDVLNLGSLLLIAGFMICLFWNALGNVIGFAKVKCAQEDCNYKVRVDEVENMRYIRRVVYNDSENGLALIRKQTKIYACPKCKRGFKFMEPEYDIIEEDER